MNTGRLFWGMLFLSAGILLLLDRLGVFAVTWAGVWQLWPLVLVFWGAALVLSGTRMRWVAVALAAVTVAVVVAAVVNFLWRDGSFWRPRTVTRQELVEPMQEPVEAARLRFDSGAGRFLVVDTTAELMVADIASSLGSYQLTRTSRDTLVDLSLMLEGETHIPVGRVSNTVEFRLNPRPLWKLEFDVGAAELRMDLAPYRVSELVVDCGASSVFLKLGDRADRMRVVIDAGASSVRLRVPDNVGCRVELDAGLSSKRLRDFVEVGDGVYETEDFGRNPREVLVILDAGVSSIRVDRYHTGSIDSQW